MTSNDVKSNVYTVKRGDCAWKLAQKSLKAKGQEVNNDTIIQEMKNLAKANNCDSVDDFNKKFFSTIGLDLKLTSNPENVDCESTLAGGGHSEQLDSAKTAKSLRAQRDSSVVSERTVEKADSTRVEKVKVARGDSTHTARVDSAKMTQAMRRIAQGTALADSTSWKDIQAQYTRINQLSDDKSKVLEWHKQNPTDQNFVIVDKKACKATVYSPDGKEVTSFMVGLGRQKGDDYMKPNNERPMTSAGIYTIDYRGNGRDGYARLYNDNIFTLTTDKGATGIALHQIPNGNKARKGVNYDGNLENNRYSNGCVNFEQKDFKELEKHIGLGAKVYILPEDDNNYFVVKNGQLNLTQKKFTGQVMTSKKSKNVSTIKIKANKGFNKNSKAFAQSIVSSKKSLMKDLNLDNDTYNNLASLAMGIAGQESQYGESNRYKLKESMQGAVSFAKSILGNKSYNSRGLTQMKIESYTDPKVKEMFKKYGITPESVEDPKKSAQATIIVLSCMMKEIPKSSKIDKMDALLYIWNNKKKELTRGTATPDKNLYVQNVRKYAKDFEIYQA